MEETVDKRRSDMHWGIPVSVIAHLAVAIIAIFGIPLELPQPPQEEPVNVEIVEPPPEPEPETAPEPEESAQPEPAPPPPADEPEAQPEPEPEQAQEQEPPAEGQVVEQPPIPTLRPVFEFGEETTGPRVSPDGNASTEGAPEDRQADDAEAEEEVPQSEAPETLSAPPDVDGDAAAAETALPPPTEEPAEAEEPVEENLPVLPEAQTIFSEDMTEDPMARIAMADVPRELRATQLCETELTAQLRNGSPSRNPDFIPRSPLPDGTILELRGTAFRAEGRWYDLSFRCEINGEATKVVSFAFDVGDPVPRSEWRNRGFPGS